jgi:Ca-activated chloride channel family protein
VTTPTKMNVRNRTRSFLPALVLAVLAVFLLGGVVIAQKLQEMPPPPPLRYKPKPTPTPTPLRDEDYGVVKVSSNLVMVPVSVVDAQGQAVHGLQVNDFRIEEEGRQQEIAQIGNPEQVPLDIAVLFDVSSSVSQKGFFAFQQKAASSFLRQVLKPADHAAVFTITDQPRMVQPLAGAENAAAKIVSISAATSAVPTAFFDTVIAAANYLTSNSPQRRRRVIVVISDGDDNVSSVVKELTRAEVRASERGEVTPPMALKNLEDRNHQAVLEVQRAVQRADAAFYSINPGGLSIRLNQRSTRAQNAMESIAVATGGSAFVPDGEKDLERVFNEVAAELRGQYLLQYYSTSQAPNEQFRRIAVSVPSHRELRVRARQGYYPKGEKQ